MLPRRALTVVLPRHDRVATLLGQVPRPVRVVPVELAEAVIEEQFDAAMDYLFSHPLWEQFRSGSDAVEPLLAYLIETRHYLAAAPARMAPGVSCSYPDSDITEILARHLIEESNHAIYFERALETLGVSAATARSIRPDPRTIELIHLMRDVASHDPLCAAVCSGLLESTANDRDGVLRWHDMLVQRGLLPASTVEAFKRHVAVDYELGHGRTWRRVLRALGPTVHSDRLAIALNASTQVAEMLFRWFSAFQQGSSGMAVLLLSQDDAGAERADEPAADRDRFWSGIPVWPASVMHATAYAANHTFAVRAALSSMVLLEQAPPGVDCIRVIVVLRGARVGRRQSMADPRLQSGIDHSLNGSGRGRCGDRLALM